ncbi:tRNA (adenosine(37)-N6)-threonylcarbamoyltransferase complex ATPase subunit type 1 TsaE [Selenomonas sp. TAMA-11512]|uniref:tRNA (adenosine(37)-N6)-threonylcarbamoyltransferase complex ATPase subunit type 1 TsaE n=1 Tax=Selenomonas sp. TAMA-11512 TaxID=3095337 RepID=UPI00309036DB|nr:tRNA (adenosine(37)-N6)-threonylcarbamoyltransferase complex ATPase subunit type 1 TsaE [Selenomonas sp. TAMA-11512]
MQYRSTSPEETAALARAIGTRLTGGLVLALKGDLGAGKTLFTQNLLLPLGITGVNSPTFCLMNVYQGSLDVQHFDLYRIAHEEELEGIGFGESLENDAAVTIVEWPDAYMDWLPDDYILVELERLDDAEDQRQITFTLVGCRWEKFFEEVGLIVGSCH